MGDLKKYYYHYFFAMIIFLFFSSVEICKAFFASVIFLIFYFMFFICENKFNFIFSRILFLFFFSSSSLNTVHRSQSCYHRLTKQKKELEKLPCKKTKKEKSLTCFHGRIKIIEKSSWQNNNKKKSCKKEICS